MYIDHNCCSFHMEHFTGVLQAVVPISILQCGILSTNIELYLGITDLKFWAVFDIVILTSDYSAYIINIKCGCDRLTEVAYSSQALIYLRVHVCRILNYICPSIYEIQTCW
jgi:hypothetical protein